MINDKALFELQEQRALCDRREKRFEMRNIKECLRVRKAH